jgi:transcriptional regulator GlxA family with amidase domain
VRHQDATLTIPAIGALRSPGEQIVIERRVVLVTFPSAQVLDVTGPLEVFSTASRSGPPVAYRTQVVSLRGGPVLTSSGLELGTTSMTDVTGPLDTLVVTGGRDMEEACADSELVEQVRRLADSARRVTSVCSGAFLLAATGLLDGRRATTHWAECSLLARDHPQVTVDPDAIYVRDGNTWTSAGVTAGIDLALALVAEDHGRQVAATAARQLVVYLRRSGGQAQFSPLLAAQAADGATVRDLLAWLPDHLSEDLTVPALAARLHLSERQFSRLFRAELDTTPADHVEAVRVEAACRLLESTHHSVEHIARTCGFGTPATLNRTFRRRLDTTPGDHRRHFGVPG